jgi:hypothetical protein
MTASCGCEFDEDGFAGAIVGEPFIDADGDLAEVRQVGDFPDKDITAVDGIPCTTALRTVIDVATDTEEQELVRIVRQCLDRHLFSVAEARARIAEDDMRDRSGASILARVLDVLEEGHPPTPSG